MAGDWIKFELITLDKPEVCLIADLANIDPDAVVGKLLRIWGWFDQHTEEGNALSVSKRLLDRLVGVTGFCDHMKVAGWMVEEGGLISLPNFDRHNGKTAKNRILTAKRVAKCKSGNAQGNDKGNGASVNSALPKEEKRREEELTPPVSPRGVDNPTDPGGPPKPKRKTRLPDPFLVNPLMTQWAAERAPAVVLATETEKFVNYWRGSGGTKVDWVATWRTWMLRAQEDAVRYRPGRAATQPLNMDDTTWADDLGDV